MNLKSIIFFFSFLSSLCSFGQVQSDKILLDSLKKNDELFKMLESFYKPSSYLQVSVGVTNKSFGLRNEALNDLQTASQIIGTPSAAYYHKSGLGIAWTGFLSHQKGSTSLYQHSVTPSFEFITNKNYYAAISYTHYFLRNLYDPLGSPVQNDFYGSFILKKMWLRPGLTVNYSTGKYSEIFKVDTIFRRRNEDVMVQFMDTMHSSLRSYSASALGEHSFKSYGLFSHRDAVILTMQAMVNFSYTNFTVTHNSGIDKLSLSKKKIKKFRNSIQPGSAALKAESIGLNLYCNYLLGNLIITPTLYADYYLSPTDTNRFSEILNLSVGYRF
ncbi:MAG: hypothetical protein ABJA57_12580 [Ginsengibacter sp.]